MISRPLGRALLGLALAVLAAWGTAAGVRYGLIQRDDLGAICEAPGSGAPGWCAVRLMFIHGFVYDVYAWASLAFAALAFWRRSPVAAYAGVALGTWGMVLYSFTWSAVGFLAGALAFARVQDERHQHREA